MRRLATKACACAALLLWLAGTATAGTLRGTVRNGTTGKVAAGVQLVLLQLQGGMQPVASAKSDAQGQFILENAGVGTRPMLLRAIYNDINFHQPVPPGSSQVDIAVYEATKDANAISVTTRIVIFQPNGTALTVGEEYAVQNNSQPPKAFYSPGGSFEFKLPEDAKLQQVATTGSAGMPVTQVPIDKTKGRYAIAYAFRPGQSTVRLSYELPYPGNAAVVPFTSPYSAARLLVVAAPSLQISGAELQPSGQEQGMSIYVRDNLAANAAFSVSVSGTAAPAGESAPAAQGRGAQETTSGSIRVVPGKLDVLKWPLIVGFAVLFALGAYGLSRKSVVPVQVSVAASGTAPRAASQSVQPQIPAQTPAAPTLKEVDAQVENSLDALKDQLFRLELRRQAGTMPEDEYTRERARAEQVLRDLLRG